MGRRATSKLFLPGGQSKRVAFAGEFEFWAEGGQIYMENLETHKVATHLPDHVMRWAKDMSKNVVGKALDGSVARDKSQLVEMQRMLEEVYQLAKDELDRSEDARLILPRYL